MTSAVTNIRSGKVSS